MRADLQVGPPLSLTLPPKGGGDMRATVDGRPYGVLGVS